MYCGSKYFAAFGTPDARDLAIRTFRTLDDAWHTPTFGGYIETPANGFPQSPQPSTNASTASEAGVESGNSTLQAGPGDSGEVLFVAANSSTRPNAPGSEGLLNATQDQTRSLNVLMHGTDALAALHRATNGERQRGGRPCLLRSLSQALLAELLSLELAAACMGMRP